ncbi:MAG: A/G-specific adenine glycosylase [Gammaproteobacteria bacterium]
MDSFSYKDFASRLLDWFDHHGRHDLPWQGRDDPYRTWVSEIMLQQTQVTTVIPYFQRFMDRFPRAEDLASADIDEVLSHWSGLGYYARGRNLHKAAQEIVSSHGGVFPQDLDALTALPGIGRSTAAAILAQAHDLPHAILDGNVKRVLARVHRVDGWPGQTQVLKRLWALSEAHTPEVRCADYTQAIMDLGASICARTPQCDQCPVSDFCQGHKQGDASHFPGRKPKRQKPEREAIMLLMVDKAQRVYLEKRPPSGLWGGLWTLPQFDGQEQLLDWCDAASVAGETIRPLGAPLTHAFTHFSLHITPVLLEASPGPDGVRDRDDAHWLSGEDWPGGIAKPTQLLIERFRSARGPA